MQLRFALNVAAVIRGHLKGDLALNVLGYLLKTLLREHELASF